MTRHDATSKRERAAIYRAAAAKCLSDRNVESCMGVEYACGRTATDMDWDSRTLAYRMTMLPEGVGGYWVMEYDPGLIDYDIQQVRVLALCFMAAMVEAGDA